MARIKIFISSVQTEFKLERKALFEYILADPLLGKFFDPFLFECLPAIDQKANNIYLREVEYSDIYLGLLGKEYGNNKNGVSPTELEFDHATKFNKTRLIFVTNHSDSERNTEEIKFISKVQDGLIRKKFMSVDDLKSSVYAALVKYLEYKKIIISVPFDASINETASLSDFDSEKIKSFIQLAHSKRGFPFTENDDIEKIFIHLNLLQDKKFTNSAILLFGKSPQRFFINSEIRCASFHGTSVEKPIPSYKVFKGSVFELADQAVDFVLSKLDYRIGTRAEHIQIPGSYEIPKEVVAEAIVNAIAHRDYTSNASVQVMLFSDRLEIWNPGALPLGWTVDNLKRLHTSIPANPLLAEPMYLAGYIERLGTGTSDMVRRSLEAKLKEPEFKQEEIFKVILYRPDTIIATPQGTPQDTPHDAPHVEVENPVKKLVLIITASHSRDELQELLGLKDRKSFKTVYIDPALNSGFIEMTFPLTPTSKNQKYRLTEKGKNLRQKLVKKKI